jgi:hypothetical protein
MIDTAFDPGAGPWSTSGGAPPQWLHADLRQARFATVRLARGYPGGTSAMAKPAATPSANVIACCRSRIWFCSMH